MNIKKLLHKKGIGFICLLSLLFSPCGKLIDSNFLLHASSKGKEILKKGESETSEIPVTLKAHPVGRGNAITVSVDNEGEREYMLVDVGSSGYAGEVIYSSQAAEIEESLSSSSTTPFSTPISGQETLTKTPSSILRSPNFDRTLSMAEDEGKKPLRSPTKIITNIRKTFLDGKIAKDTEDIEIMDIPIYVKTVVITHPDADHYRWLTKLFSNKRDKIDYLIFGGQPHHYYGGVSESGREPELSMNKFIKWLKDLFAENETMKVYFPAASLASLSKIKEIKRAMGVKKGEKRKEPSTVGPPIHDLPDQETRSFKDAFNFGKNVKIHALSVNSMHHPLEPILEKEKSEKAKEVEKKEQEQLHFYSQSDPDNDNNDSLVLKIVHGNSLENSSAILTGDATSATTNRILADYSHIPEFLHTKVLLASHHGSSTHGSNGEKWIKATSPEYVIISNGHDGHPQPEAYENFKQSTRLRGVKPHKVLVGGKTPKQGPERGSLHETVRGIVSTLNSSLITVKLYKDGTLSLKTANEGKIVKKTDKKAPPISPQTPDQEEDVDIFIVPPEEESEEKVSRVIVSPSRALQKYKEESGSPYTSPGGTKSGEKVKEEEESLKSPPRRLRLDLEESKPATPSNKKTKKRTLRRKKKGAAKKAERKAGGK